MAQVNEKVKVNENATANELEVIEVDTIPEKIEGDLIETKLFVEREPFKKMKDGKVYYSYFVKGKVRDRDIKVNIIPPDQGGYAVLDLIFDVEPKAVLALVPYTMKDDFGKKVSGHSYEVVTCEGDDIYRSKVKPARANDKAFLDMLLNLKS